MTRRVILAAGYVLLVMATAFARQGGAPSDPVSGSWGMDGLPYLELKFDGNRSVSGTTIWRHDGYEERSTIATGTFDRETGALKLTGDVKNARGEVVRYVIDGTLEKNVVAGSYAVGEQKGDFRFVRL